MRLHGIISLIIIMALFSACEEELDQDLSFEAQGLIVVESVITNELKRHEVKLSRPYAAQNNELSPVSGATVVLFDGDENFTLFNEIPPGSGRYFTNDSIRAVFGKFYGLFIRYDGMEYTAFDSPPGGELLNAISLEEIDIDDQTWFTITEERTGNIPNYVEYDIDWSMTNFCLPTADCEGRVVRYDLKNVDTQNTFAPEKEEFLFPSGSRIIRRKYSISDQYQQYLRALLSETEWRGGYFDIERDNIPTNFSEGAIGFFATSTVDVDTVFVQ